MPCSLAPRDPRFLPIAALLLFGLGSCATTGEPGGPGLAVRAAAPAQETTGEARPLRSVRVEVADVFPAQEARDKPLYNLLNALHVTTLERTVWRELWMRPGDPVTPEIAAEIERNLRRTGLFSSARAELQPTADGGVDLVVRTRDRFSFTAGASGFSAGGVDGFNVNLGENNLFGKGDALTVSFAENSEGETSGGVNYLDRHFHGTRQRLRLSAGETDEGQRFSVAFDRPLWHLEDDWAWGTSFGFAESDTDYFAGGDTVAEVPVESTSASAFVSRTGGPRFERTTWGLELTFRRGHRHRRPGHRRAGRHPAGDPRALRALRLDRSLRQAAFRGLPRVRRGRSARLPRRTLRWRPTTRRERARRTSRAPAPRRAAFQP
jgi:hypothetical protein